MTHSTPTAIEAARKAIIGNPLNDEQIERMVSAYLAALPVEAEAVAWVQADALKWLKKDKFNTATVASPLVHKPMGNPVALYSASALAALSSQCEALRGEIIRALYGVDVDRTETTSELLAALIALTSTQAVEAERAWYPWTARLAHINLRTAAELEATKLKNTIESLGAHPLLTEALTAADQAMRILGRWHDDGEPGASPAKPSLVAPQQPSPGTHDIAGILAALGASPGALTEVNNLIETKVFQAYQVIGHLVSETDFAHQVPNRPPREARDAEAVRTKFRPFSKSVGGDFDRIDLTNTGASDWLHITMRVGHDVERISMTLRSDEAVRDLHYALGRYLAEVDGL